MPTEVILLERIEKLGQMGDVVRVKPGFARNYLLPQKKALRATKDNLTYFDTQRGQLEAQNLERRKDAEAVAIKVDGMTVRLIRQAGDTGHLYGSVTVRDIADAVSAAGITIDRRQVQLDQPIKLLGLHSLRIRLHPEVAITITANVARSEDEAAAQARGESVLDRDREPAAEEPKGDTVAEEGAGVTEAEGETATRP
ncbi:MAG: 50S ribosomal protein L9 [Alphaproteobacteria bacterium]|nr:50S ribosomal protein L9 [Alphaproteobacteria bacterium]